MRKITKKKERKKKDRKNQDLIRFITKQAKQLEIPNDDNMTPE